MKKNGFTLIELIVTIVLLGIVATIVIYNLSTVNNSNIEKEYDDYREAVLRASEKYSNDQTELFNESLREQPYFYITTGDLVSNGLLSRDLVNPRTKEKMSSDEKIKVYKDETTGNIRFEYPVEE